MKHALRYELGMPDVYSPIGYFGSSYFGDDTLAPAPPPGPPDPPPTPGVSFTDLEFRAYQ